MNYIVIIVIIVIYAFASQPLHKAISKRISNKLASHLVSFAIGVVILTALFFLANKLGLM